MRDLETLERISKVLSIARQFPEHVWRQQGIEPQEVRNLSDRVKAWVRAAPNLE